MIWQPRTRLNLQDGEVFPCKGCGLNMARTITRRQVGEDYQLRKYQQTRAGRMVGYYGEGGYMLLHLPRCVRCGGETTMRKTFVRNAASHFPWLVTFKPSRARPRWLPAKQQDISRQQRRNK